MRGRLLSQAASKEQEVLGFFNKQKPKPAYEGPPLDPKWVRNRNDKFFRLMHLDPVVEGLQGLSGVYVIWHSGVKPGWVFVGRTNDLASTLEAALDDDDIMEYERNGWLYVTWSPILKESQGGVVKFLHDAMKPKTPNPEVGSIKDGPINVIIPKRRGV